MSTSHQNLHRSICAPSWARPEPSPKGTKDGSYRSRGRGFSEREKNIRIPRILEMARQIVWASCISQSRDGKDEISEAQRTPHPGKPLGSDSSKVEGWGRREAVTALCSSGEDICEPALEDRASWGDEVPLSNGSRAGSWSWDNKPPAPLPGLRPQPWPSCWRAQSRPGVGGPAASRGSALTETKTSYCRLKRTWMPCSGGLLLQQSRPGLASPHIHKVTCEPWKPAALLCWGHDFIFLGGGGEGMGGVVHSPISIDSLWYS